MTRIPLLERDQMDANQQIILDRITNKGGRIGFGPAIGYAYSAEVWRLHNESSAHLLDCTLTNAQVRIVSLMPVRHWKASYPWSAQAKTAMGAGLDIAIIEAINADTQPEFAKDDDAAVYDVTKELLTTGNIAEHNFNVAVNTLGHKGLVELIHTIGHFCTTALMANAVGVTSPEDAVSRLKG